MQLEKALKELKTKSDKVMKKPLIFWTINLQEIKKC